MFNLQMLDNMKGNTLLLAAIAALLCGSLYLSYMNFQQMQQLRQENTDMLMKIDSLQQVFAKAPQVQPAAPVAPAQAPALAPAVKQKTTGSAFLDFLLELDEESEKEIAAEKAKQKVEVTTKYRLEDRYVTYKVHEPEIIGNQAGEVLLNILVDKGGSVKSAKLKSATGITDEEVIEACKKAALQTNFNSNYDHSDNRPGTITYIFTAK